MLSLRTEGSHEMEEVRRKLKDKGFVKIPASIFHLDEKEIDELQLEVDRLFDGKYDTGIYPDEIHWRRGISSETATREICNGWKASNRVASLVCSERLGTIACELMGWESCRIGQDDVLDKPPGGGTPVGFHQDGVYISDNFTPTDDNCLTMWIALDDADEENGALQYAPGSHLWNSDLINTDEGGATTTTSVSELSFHAGENDHMKPLRRAAQVGGHDSTAVERTVETVCVRAGEMVVHHQRTWHGSGRNMSLSRHRKSIVAHLLNGSVEWRLSDTQNMANAAGRPHYIYGRYYIRGETIPREDFFPKTFARASSSFARTSWLDREFDIL